MYLPHMALYCLAIIKSTEANQFQAQEIPGIARAAYCPPAYKNKNSMQTINYGPRKVWPAAD